jgi:hypothetical protein
MSATKADWKKQVIMASDIDLWDLFGVFDLVSFAFAIHACSSSTALMYSLPCAS